jgi:CRP-like cAMP-binding protein
MPTAGPGVRWLRPLVRLCESGSITSTARALFRAPDGAVSGRDETLVEFLGHVPLFADLARRDLVRLAQIVHERDYRDGEYICEEGKPSAVLFVLRRGVLDVVKRGASGQEVPIAMLEPPASFEEAAAVGPHTTRWFSVRARGAVWLLALGKSDLDALSVNFPLLANKVLMRLAGVMATRLQLLLEAVNLEESGEQREADR